MSTPDETRAEAAREWLEKTWWHLTRWPGVLESLVALLCEREASVLQERRPCACGEDAFSVETAIKAGRCYNCRQKSEAESHVECIERQSAALRDAVETARREGWKAGAEAMRERLAGHLQTYRLSDTRAEIRSFPLPEMPTKEDP